MTLGINYACPFLIVEETDACGEEVTYLMVCSELVTEPGLKLTTTLYVFPCFSVTDKYHLVQY